MEAAPPTRPPSDLGSGANQLPHSPRVLLLVDFINPLRFDGGTEVGPAALATLRQRWIPLLLSIALLGGCATVTNPVSGEAERKSGT